MNDAVRHWVRQPDHYYWITAVLAARGDQRLVCKGIAVPTAFFGVLPLIMLASPAGAQGPVSRTITVIVAVSTFLLAAAIWFRPQWPSRTQSIAVMVLIFILISAAALTMSDPVTGIAAGMTYPALAGLVVFFHASRSLIPILLGMLAVLGVPALRLAAAGDPAWAFCLMACIFAATSVVAALCHLLVILIGIKVPGSDIEPVTGLLNREAFYEATGSFIASRSRLDDRHLVLLVVNLDNYALLTGAHATAAQVTAGQALRTTTRRDAVVAHIADSEFVVADSFVSPDASPLVERVRSALRGTSLRMTASIGVVSTPMAELAACPPYDLLDELIALATTAMFEVRRSGGNDAQYVVCERPAALEGYPGSAEDAC